MTSWARVALKYAAMSEGTGCSRARYSIYIHTHTCIHAYIHAYTHTHTDTHTHTYIYIYTFIYIYTCIYIMYIYTCIYIHIYTPWARVAPGLSVLNTILIYH